MPIEDQPVERVRFHVGVRRSSAGGRPPLPADRRRSVSVTVRLSPAEFERAFDLARARGARNVRAFLRSAVLEFGAPARLTVPPPAPDVPGSLRGRK